MAGFRPCFIQDCELAERVSQLPTLIYCYSGAVEISVDRIDDRVFLLQAKYQHRHFIFHAHYG